MSNQLFIDGRAPVALSKDRLLVGRGDGCDVMLPEEDAGASRRHAQIERDGHGDWSVVDLGSRNGVLVNSQRISGRTVLRDGDRVQVGATKIVLSLREATRSAAPRPTESLATPRAVEFYAGPRSLEDRRLITRGVVLILIAIVVFLGYVQPRIDEFESGLGMLARMLDRGSEAAYEGFLFFRVVCAAVAVIGCVLAYCGFHAESGARLSSGLRSLSEDVRAAIWRNL